MIVLANKWRLFFDYFLPSRLSGDTAVCVVIVHQCALWLALVGAPWKIFFRSRGFRHYIIFLGQNLTCTCLCVGLVYLSWWPFQFICSECGQTCHWRWIHIHDHTMSQCTAGNYWSLEKYVLFVLESAGLGETGVMCALTWCLLFIVAWRVESQLMPRRSRVCHF